MTAFQRGDPLHQATTFTTSMVSANRGVHTETGGRFQEKYHHMVRLIDGSNLLFEVLQIGRRSSQARSWPGSTKQ